MADENRHRSEGVIVRLPQRHPLSVTNRDTFVDMLRKKITGRVLEAHIFGSFFTERFGRDSDLDLILIVDSPRPFVERGRDFLDILSLGIPVDLLVYTPEEWARLRDETGPGFWGSVRSTIRQIL